MGLDLGCSYYTLLPNQALETETGICEHQKRVQIHLITSAF